MADAVSPSQAEIHLAVRLVQNDLALRLAFNDGYLDSPDSWEGAGAAMRKCYIDLARETLAVMGGPIQAQQDAAALRAEVRELRRQRDRYRDAWLSACRRARWARVALSGPEKPPQRPSAGLAASTGKRVPWSGRQAAQAPLKGFDSAS